MVSNKTVTISPGEIVIIKVLDNDTLILDQVTGGSQGTATKVVDNNGNLNWFEYTALNSTSGSDEFFYGVADELVAVFS